ncbi:MAG: ribosomal RNA small subunit methyltransferase A [Fibrobacteres bacterium]|nr:ribosomal RNA small subunit methyltransferase A [Fibrobacterota bacterium]
MDHTAKKRFGQHFLTSARIIERIIDASIPGEGDAIVEIGPGQGAITGDLIKKHHNTFTAIELDRDLIPLLKERFGSIERFSIIESDVLKVNFADCAPDKRQLTIVGNLPYNVGSIIILKMAEEREVIRKAYVMLQKEVGERLTAICGTSEYSFLSVAIQTFATVKRLFTIPPGAFSPPPKVDSAFLEISFSHEPDMPKDYKRYTSIVSNAFSQRRKKVINVLSRHYDKDTIAKFFADNSINENARAENLTVKDYIRLYETLQ